MAASLKGHPGLSLQEELDKEWKSFHTTLDPFPHSFQLEDQEQVTVSTCRTLQDVLQADLDAGLATPLEVARSRNLLAYLHFMRGSPGDADEHTEAALSQEGEGRNLVSLANRACMLWQTGQRSRAQQDAKSLSDMAGDDDFNYLVVKAKAEVAFSYTRIGGHFASKAVPLFTTVISEAREPEIWLWKFGLALTERRLVHMHSASVVSDETENTKLLDALRIFLEVIEKCQSKSLKAKCYAEIAQLLQTKRRTKFQEMFEREAKLTPTQACNKALQLDQNDSSVLWKCGKIFRYAKFLDDSAKHLEKAVEKRPTSTEFHHLGLTYKDLAIRDKNSDKSGCRGRGRGRGSGRGNTGRPIGKDSWRGRVEHESQMKGRITGGVDWNRRGRGTQERTDSHQYSQAHTGLFDDSHMYGRQGTTGRVGSSHRGGRYVHDMNRDRPRGRGQWRAQSPSYDTSRFPYAGSYSQLRAINQQTTQGNPSNPDHAEQFVARQEDHSEIVNKDWSDYGACSSGYASMETFGQVLQPLQQSRHEDAGHVSDTDSLLDQFSSLSLTTDNLQTNPTGSARYSQISSGNTHCFSPSNPSRPEIHSARPSRDKTPEAATSQSDIRCLRSLVKSPSKLPRLSRSHHFVQKAMDAFQTAIDRSQGNIRALYDLALMHRAVGELDEALRLLDIIQLGKFKGVAVGPFDKINAFEQAGLILKDKSENEGNEELRMRFNEEGECKLNMALRLCSRLCSRLPKLQHYIQHVWHAFPILFKQAETSDRKDTDKLFEKARLFKLIKDNHQSVALLEDIRKITPAEANNPKHLKMCIENYVDLKQYDQALTFIEMLNNTAQRDSTMGLFEDDQYIQRVYLEAAKDALLTATSSDALNRAASYFSSAFRDTLVDDSDQDSGSEDARSTEDGDEDDPCTDIMLLHEDSATDKATVIANILRNVCGLRVTRMDEDCLAGRLYLHSLLCRMKQSSQVLVLAGGRLTEDYALLVEKAATRPSTVALLVEGNRIPKALRSTQAADRRLGGRCRPCPEDLLVESRGGDAHGGTQYSTSTVEAICDVFSFLIDVSI